jgi:hypothetical protein
MPDTPADFLRLTLVPASAGHSRATADDGGATPRLPLINLAGTFSLPLAVEQTLVADSKNRPWLKDYLGNVGNAGKASPNSALKVTIPASASGPRPLAGSQVRW